MLLLQPEFKQRWVGALRSGRYRQSKHHLQNELGFCCLGVACDVVADEIDGLWLTAGEGTVIQAFLAGDDEDAEVLPDPVLSHIAASEDAEERLTPALRLPRAAADALLAIDDPRLTGGLRERLQEGDYQSCHCTLAELNDAGFTFPEIADLIERYL